MNVDHNYDFENIMIFINFYYSKFAKVRFSVTTKYLFWKFQLTVTILIKQTQRFKHSGLCFLLTFNSRIAPINATITLLFELNHLKSKQTYYI